MNGNIVDIYIRDGQLEHWDWRTKSKGKDAWLAVTCFYKSPPSPFLPLISSHPPLSSPLSLPYLYRYRQHPPPQPPPLPNLQNSIFTIFKRYSFSCFTFFSNKHLSLACISFHPPTPNPPTPPPSPPPLFGLNIANFVVAIVFIFLKGIPEKIKSLAYNNYFCHVISFQAIKKEGRHY